jgi:hypothetical protein
MTKEQQFLVQKVQDSLRAAKLLGTEGMADFAISRAYGSIGVSGRYKRLVE